MRRRLRGFVLLGGAAAILILVVIGPLEFFWVPLLIGATYAAAAFVGGSGGGLWGPAAVLVVFGLAVVALNEGWIDRGEGPVLVTAVGLGALLAVALARSGRDATFIGTAIAITVVGFIYLLQPDIEFVNEAIAYVILLAVWGVIEIVTRDGVMGLAGRGGGRRGRGGGRRSRNR